MRGDFSFHREKGVWIEDAEHDEKCLRLLRLAKKRYCDLVLFPEYCISEQVIVNIIEDESLWPENHKLWVLPCQGMEKEKFDSLIKKLSDLDGVFPLDTACNSWGCSPIALSTPCFTASLPVGMVSPPFVWFPN